MTDTLESGPQETYRQCPKCGRVFPHALPASARCPGCGIYFFKWAQRSELDATRDEAMPGLLQRLLEPIPGLDASSFYGRCGALALLAFWSWHLIGCDYRDGEIFGSFMHSILLPIHEAGHVLLMPFGEFMTILGGSLLQLALPLGIAVAFARNRDNFGAALGLWWAGISLLDLAPYIYDALHPQLILLGGYTGEDGPHDWIFLLGAFGQIPRAQHWGALVHGLGIVLAVSALLWAATVLRRQYQLQQEDS